MDKGPDRLTAKNKWFYSTGCIGRDMAYTLFSMFLITFVLYTKGLTDAQIVVLTVVLFVCRVWDAVNDPMFGAIIANTKSKNGRYRPWILIGAITNAFTLIALFAVPLYGWAYVVFFGVMYLLWDITFTMNDVGYWSLLPALAKEKNDRDQLTTLVAVFASLGAFIVGGLIPIITPGNAIAMYRISAIVISLIFVACQVSVFFFVKENDVDVESQEHVSLKKIFSLIIKNKQLLVMSIVILLYSLGSALLNAFGTTYFWLEFSYGGLEVTIFTVIYAIGTIISQAFYAKLAKHFTRAQLIKYGTILLIVGYLAFFVVGAIPMPNSIKLILLCILGVFIFAGQGAFYLTMLVMTANIIEYDQWKTGERNESVIFSIRPFMVKLASAFQQVIVTATLMITGLYTITQDISKLEQDAKGNISDTVKAQANALIESGKTTPAMIGLLVGMTILPIIMFIINYILLKKKYIIDEAFYEKICKEIEERKVK